MDVEGTGAIGPNSIAYYDGLVYVTNIDANGDLGKPIQEGNIIGYDLTETGQLFPIPEIMGSDWSDSIDIVN